MQEEVNQKTVALSIRTTKLTGKVLAAALGKVVRALQKHHRKALTPQGRQSVKKLMNHYGGKSAMPYVGAPKDFDRIAKEFHVDYAFHKVSPGHYLLNCGNMGAAEVLRSLFKICVFALFNFVAVAPLIAWFGRKRDSFFAGVGIAFFYGFCGIFVAGRNLTDFYPITAGLGIIRYAGQDDAAYNPLIGCIVLALMVLLTVALVATCPAYDKVIAPSKNKSKKNQPKRVQH